jgi:hypothetical protein
MESQVDSNMIFVRLPHFKSGQKRKRNTNATMGPKDTPSPSPVKVLRKSSTSLRAAMTKMQKDRKVSLLVVCLSHC